MARFARAIALDLRRTTCFSSAESADMTDDVHFSAESADMTMGAGGLIRALNEVGA
jgi:hypothetical protein